MNGTAKDRFQICDKVWKPAVQSDVTKGREKVRPSVYNRSEQEEWEIVENGITGRAGMERLIHQILCALPIMLHRVPGF